MAAPNLRDNVPPEHMTEADNSASAILFPKPSKVEPARTLSPFNSPALKVQEPPRIDPQNSLAAPLPLSAPIERSGLLAGYGDEDENEIRFEFFLILFGFIFHNFFRLGSLLYLFFFATIKEKIFYQ